jgi:glycosyltransferase involved in cell wall biosynthesis
VRVVDEEMPEQAPAPGEPSHLSVVQVVRSDAFAGVERYICQVSNGLAARGHRVVAVGGDPSRMRAELDGEVRHLPAASMAGAAWALARQRPADVVHVHMTAAEGAAWLARPAQRAPIVATRHFPGSRGSTTISRTLARVTSRVVSRDIAISRFVADRLEGPSVLLYNGVPDRPQAALASTSALMLQRLTDEKAPEVGLQAWASSDLGSRGWRLVVAGTGDLRSRMEEAARTLGITGSVEFAGQVADTDRLLGDSALLLAPAPEEPFGLSVVEAMAHGLPVVAAAGGAHLETIGGDGLLFPPGDAAAAAGALAALADDHALRRQVGGRLRERQRRLFSLSRHLDGLEQIYGDVMLRAGAHRL